MKILAKALDKNFKGFIKLQCENSEDIWHLYNIIHVEDLIKANTIRKVQIENNNGEIISTKRMNISLKIKVEKIDCDMQNGSIRMGGPIKEENKHVRMGSYHTIEIESGRSISIEKELWYEPILNRLNDSIDPTKSADVAAILIQDGIANIILVTQYSSISRMKIEVNIPKKRKGYNSSRENAIKRFFENILNGILKHINNDLIKCVIIASPGFLKEDFFNYLSNESIKRDLKIISELLKKVILVHSSSGHKHSLNEILNNESIKQKMSNTKASKDISLLEEFYTNLGKNDFTAVYGLKDVEMANDSLAIKTLMITDDLLRSTNIIERKKYLNLIEIAKRNGAKINIFSSLHNSGERLKLLTGIAALLRFPI